MRSLSFAGAGALLLLLAACGLDGNGLGPGDDGGGPDGSDDGLVPLPDATGGDAGGHVDATTDSGSGDAGDTGPSGDDSGGMDAPNDTGNTGDAGGPDANDSGGGDSGGDAGRDTGACSSPEICNNGLDDDCNGVADCADPACSQWTCTAAAIPAGWSVVDFVETDRPPCSTGYSGSVDVIESPDAGPATCACTCTVTTPGSCTSGSFSVGAGLGMCGPSMSYPGASGACTQGTPFTVITGTKAQANAAPYVAGACDADAGVTLPPVSSNQGRVCSLSTATGGGCAGGGACTPLGAASICISQAGEAACPNGFPSRFTVGTGLDDSRTCSGCACTGTSGDCIDAKLTMFTDTKCSAGGTDVAADSTCSNVGGPPNVTYNAYTYTATLNGEACIVTPASPGGGVALTGVQTICCP